MKRPPNTLLSILFTLGVLAMPATAAAVPATFEADQPVSGTGDYWTAARMRAAEPVPATMAGKPDSSPSTDQGSPSFVPPASPGAAPDAQLLQGEVGDPVATGRVLTEVLDATTSGVRAHGKVFFTIPKGTDSGDFVCSGTAVNSRNRSVVMTAGHCVFDSQTGGGKATNWIFVPAFRQGETPFGQFEAKKLATTKQWKKQSNLRFDLGAAVVRRNSDGQQLQSAVGARGIGFSQPRDQSFDIFGYPAETPFDGRNEYLCTSISQGSDAPPGGGPDTMAADCAMTGGASGGGWVVGNTLVSVISYGYRSQPGILFGPYFASAAKKLYKSVRGPKPD